MRPAAGSPLVGAGADNGITAKGKTAFRTTDPPLGRPMTNGSVRASRFQTAKWSAGSVSASPRFAAHTGAAILRRHKRIVTEAAPEVAGQRFERSRPNELWQVDFKGHVEVARKKVYPLTVFGEHSRSPWLWAAVRM